MLQGAFDPTGESLTVELRDPQAVTAVSILPHADGSARVRAIDVLMRSEDGVADA